jgi:tetratricopeptide (TPR) repeat protein
MDSYLLSRADHSGECVSGETRQLFERALARHRSGDGAGAEQDYRAVLAAEPTHFGAAHMLGVVFMQHGRFDLAERQLRRALQLDPYAADALNYLGMTLRNLDRLDEALDAYDRAIALRPAYAEAFCNRGNALRVMRRRDAALESYAKAIALRPSYADAYYNRAGLFEEMANWDDAVAGYEMAVALKADFPEALNNLGNALRGACHYEEALTAYDRALLLSPNYAEAMTNRGNVLRDLHRYDEALASHDRALALKPDLAEAFNNRGSVHHDTRRFDAAKADYRHALSLKPDHFDARSSLALTHLLLGEWEEGWKNYELRFRKPHNATRRPDNPASEWNGEDLAGKRLLAYGEQGFGDMIQFVRFVPLLEELGAEVTVLVPRRLHRLLATVSPTARFVDGVGPEDRFDFQVALMSAPGVLGVMPGSVPDAVPYLAADSKRHDIWRARLGEHGFKVGIAWQGNPAGSIDNGRSVPLREFAPLSQINGVRLVSLQKNHGVEQLDRKPPGMIVETPGFDFDEGADAFIDTAAMMANLDLVVTSDTSIAHLAGALGRPVWIALKHVPDWRWLLDRADSPWYPTARLFRQTRSDDWSGVVHEMATTIADLVEETGNDDVTTAA